MNVLLASSNSGSTGGGEIYLVRLALGLSKLGHRVHALASTATAMDKLVEDLRRYCDVTRVDILNNYNRPTRSLGAILDFEQQKRFNRVVHDISPDILHINQQVAEDGLDMILAARNSGIPFLSTIHITHSATQLGARFGRLRDFMASVVLRRAHAIHITVADCARNVLLNRFGFLEPHQVRAIVNGVLFPDPDENVRHSVRCRWGAGPSEVVLGSVGRLNAQKEPIFALEIIAALRQKGLPIRYIWIGDGSLRDTFLEKVRDLGLSDHVTLEGWRDDVASCLQGLDIFVMPSNFEGMPLALLEAMAAGLCCCVSSVDGMAEVIEHGLNGYLCAPRCSQSWCRRLEALIVDSGLRSAVGRKARDVAWGQFSVERMAADTSKVYEDIVGHCQTVSSVGRAD